MASKREVAAKLTPADLALLADAAEGKPVANTKRLKALVKLIRSVPGVVPGK